MNLSVIGCGRWGSFLAWYLRTLGHGVLLYGRKGSAHLEQFRNTRSNGLVVLEDDVALTDSLEDTVCHLSLIHI